jgi:Putative prokaryotic signal transducing protein
MIADELITLRTFSSFVDAQAAVGHLESHGIKAMIKKDDSGGMRPHYQQTHGVDVVVNKKDARRARNLLAAMKVR